MTAPPVGLENNRTSSRPEITTMPSNSAIRSHPIGGGGRHLPYPRPTVSLDPRPVVIPILSSVIGFPIVVFALICALRHRAIKLRKRDQLRKLQAGIRSVTLDLPPREKVSFYSGCSSPDISLKEAGEKLESMNLKSSLCTTKRTGKSNSHVTFATPDSTTASSTPNATSANVTTVEVLLHVDSATISSASDPRPNGGMYWRNQNENPLPSIQIERVPSSGELSLKSHRRSAANSNRRAEIMHGS